MLGLNGSGKSSLLKILAGVDKNFEGQISLSPGYTVGYLEQEPQLDETKTVRQVVEEGVQETVDLLKEFERINEKFAEPMDDDADEQAAGAAGRSAGEARSPRRVGPRLSSSRWRWTPCAARRPMRS